MSVVVNITQYCKSRALNQTLEEFSFSMNNIFPNKLQLKMITV